VRVLEGPHTQLNWPAHLYADQEHGELFVANDAGDSILVFRETDSGDAAPARVLQGSRTQLKNPIGVYLDSANDELVVANMGNHRATVYHRTVQGDTPPIRTIRSAPDGLPALQIGNPGSVAYDTKRDQIIVPN
jgi:DNA-binding beta-propeller fold protein YncE